VKQQEGTGSATAAGKEGDVASQLQGVVDVQNIDRNKNKKEGVVTAAVHREN
jgi:hypothetical protein